MAMKGNTGGKVANVVTKTITALMIIILILGIAGLIAFFVMRILENTFYVEYNGQRYISGTYDESLELFNGQTYTFSVKSLTGGDVDYSVKVISNGSYNFYFVIGDELYVFYSGDDDMDDYSAVFCLETEADGFSITIPQGMTVEKALELKYGEEVVLLDDISSESCYFVLSVVSSDGREVDLPFSFRTAISGIAIDPPQIVF